MKVPPRARCAATLLAMLVLAACGGAATGRVQPAPAADAGTAEIEALYHARLDSTRTRFTEADVRFMSGMIGHHTQALVMARLAHERAASTAVKTLAARILSAQQDEIVLMQQWLRQRGQPVPEVDVSDGTRAAHVHHGPDMPGMLTEAQLQELERARAAEFDRLFLRHMIQHHRGAVLMVRELFGTDGAGQDPTVFKFASDVQVDQLTEIARMERMLREIPEPEASLP